MPLIHGLPPKFELMRNAKEHAVILIIVLPNEKRHDFRDYFDRKRRARKDGSESIQSLVKSQEEPKK
jgi:hypothetical protein